MTAAGLLIAAVAGAQTRTGALAVDKAGLFAQLERKPEAGSPERPKSSGGLLDFLEWDPAALPQTWHGPGTYQGGPVIHTLVTNLAGDARLEIVVQGLAGGLLWAFDHQGLSLSGWENGAATPSGGVAYPVARHSVRLRSQLAATTFEGDLVRFAADGSILWGDFCDNFCSSPPSISVRSPGADCGEAVLHLGEENRAINSRELRDGSVTPGWPYEPDTASQTFWTPAIADLDGDGEAEVLSAGRATTAGVDLVAVRSDGTELWAHWAASGFQLNFPVVADLDGDEDLEVVFLAREAQSPFRARLEILDHLGSVVWSQLLADGVSYGTAPALADLDSDGRAEVVVQLAKSLVAIQPYVGYLPGWPVDLTEGTGSGHQDHSSPVVGDVDGDLLSEIVVTFNRDGGRVFVFEADGTLAGGITPTPLPIGAGAVPAIVDVDLDGHNEIVITGSYWDGISGWYDKVWMFDLSRDDPAAVHGPVEWGQFMGNAQHTGVYPSTGGLD